MIGMFHDNWHCRKTDFHFRLINPTHTSYCYIKLSFMLWLNKMVIFWNVKNDMLFTFRSAPNRAIAVKTWRKPCLNSCNIWRYDGTRICHNIDFKLLVFILKDYRILFFLNGCILIDFAVVLSEIIYFNL
jgi:hypothetical protein